MTDIALIGHEVAETSFVDAMHSGKLHHGWMIEGPAGIGKARLALRLAVRLLRGDPDAPKDSVRSKVLGGAHPDFRLLSRVPDGKVKTPQDIAVSEARDLNAFFQLRPAMGGARVGIIDSLDKLNRFGANAILKTLEEPPAGAVLILVSHGQRPVLPTIRSRCRVLRLSRLTPENVRAAVELAREVVSPDAVAIAGGRPGLAIQFSGEIALAAAESVGQTLVDAPRLRAGRVAQAISLMAADSDAFSAGAAQVLQWVRLRALEGSAQSRVAWSECWLDLSRELARGRELSSDPRQISASLFRRLQTSLEI